MDTQITLKYQKNQSQEIRIEELNIFFQGGKWSIKEDTPSFFWEEYKEAIDILNGILCLPESDNKRKNNNGKEEGKKQNEESINNRILFVGQRGTGKTSAMKSFAEGLNKAKDDRGKVFTCLPMVDPSNFDNNTNILLTVITMMFSEAKELMKKNNNDEDVISKREDLLKKFDEVFKSLKAISGNDKPSFTLEGLNEKSLALRMHSGMHDLVKSYLNFYNTVNGTNVNRLILLIDDIDMTVSHVPEMLEQLRKYLDIEDLVILMSANLAQLYNEMREHYSQAFKETLKDRNQALYIDVEDLANKYLLKLFPTSRRVRVEHGVKQLIEANLEIDGYTTDISTSNLKSITATISDLRKVDDRRFRGKLDDSVVVECEPEAEQADSKKSKLQNVILSLIWEKTRLLFIPKDADNVLHPIIPTNLRELMQFLDMLTSLKEVEYTERGLFRYKKDYDKCEENVAKFKRYFLKNWIPSHLPVEEELVFENIPTDITEINKHLINSINVIGNKHKNDLMSRQVDLDMIERNADNVNIDRDIYTMVSLNDPKFIKANKISDIFNQPSNYSYGDLLLMIDKYETYFESGDNRKFTDAIKIYYTILLFETMFFKSNEVDYTISLGEYYSNTLQIYIDEYERNPTSHFTEGDVNHSVEQLQSVIKSRQNQQKVEDKKKVVKESFLKRAAWLGVDSAKGLENNKTTASLIKAKDELDNLVLKEYPNDSFFILEEAFINEIRDKIIHKIIPIQKLIGGNVYYPNYFEIITDSNFSQKGPSYDAKRAFYHKIKLEGSIECFKNQIPQKCPIFSVLYYGDIRPDRYETTHIYDTTFDNDSKVDNNYFVTFDMLSILNNMLNPWQTICRTDNAAFISKLSADISNWGNICTINDEKKSEPEESKKTPNSILPFYSVDIMLHYLKKTFSAKEIVGNRYPPKTNQVTNYNDCFKRDNKPSFFFKGNEKCEYHEALGYVWERYKSDNIFQTVEAFRSLAISCVLSEYKGSTRDRDMIIKGLHKHHTIADIYKYFVDELYDKDVNERGIKKDIQEEVHTYDSVRNYYDKLKEETNNLLKSVGIEHANKVYNAIYDTARGIFIKELD